MGEPTSSEPDSPTTSVEEIKRKTAMAELRKLELEIEELERGRKRRLARYVPILTAVISIAGFMSGLLIFGLQQSKDRKTREAETRSRELNDYRTGYEQLLLFSSNEKMTIARVLALKQDLDALKDSLYVKDEDREQQEARLRGSICNLIAKDFDFTQPRHVTFDIAALQNWPEYQQGLRATLNPDGTGVTVNESIIEKYLRVIHELQSLEPRVFKNVDTSEGVANSEILLKEPQRSVVNGFACHLSLLESNKRDQLADRFDEITGAFKLTALLKDNFRCPPLPAIPSRPKMLTNPAN